MKPPRLSVIIPTFNRRELVVEAIRSALAATGDAEVVVVDDGSADGTADAVRGTFGSNVALLVQPNRGRSAARNAGVAASRGSYLSFLDSDDVWEPWHLTQLERELVRGSSDSVYAAPVVLWDPATARTSRLSGPPPFPARDVRERCLVGMVFPLEGLFVPRLVFDAIGGFDEALGGSEDWEFLVRLVRHQSSVTRLQVPSVRVRVHAGRSMADVDWDVLWRRRATRQIVENEALTLSRHEEQLVEAATHRYCAARLYEAGRMTEARAELAAVRRLLPFVAGLRVTLRLDAQTRAGPLMRLARPIRRLAGRRL